MKVFIQVAVLLVYALGASVYCAVADAAEAFRGRRGLASWYGEGYRGKTMANGRPFNPDALTCASWEYPLGTRLLVRHGDREVEVTVTDRGPRRDLYEDGIIIDLSAHAFAAIEDPKDGIVSVTISEASDSSESRI